MTTPLLTLVLLCATMVGTSFLSGIFGMAGGLVLVGVLLALMPVPEAMALHAVTQVASNGWRALLWCRRVRWRSAAAYTAGCGLALGLWSLWRYVPDRALALVLLGATPFLVRLVPRRVRPDPDGAPQCVGFGLACMSLMLLTGVAGPLLDTFFLGRGAWERREVVATKAMCQVLGHALKLVYFAGVVEQPAAVDPLLGALAVGSSVLGTTLARRVLEAMSDAQYRAWTWRLITTIAGFYLAQGTWLMLTP
jgi:uncharacterized protein